MYSNPQIFDKVCLIGKAAHSYAVYSPFSRVFNSNSGLEEISHLLSIMKSKVKV